MNRDSTLILALVFVAFVTSCTAVQSAEPGQHLTASVARGRAVAAAQCVACHAAEGKDTNLEAPRLAGQVQEFLSLQLRNYKSGERPHPVMAAMSKALSRQDIEDVAAFYAARQPIHNSSVPLSVSAEVLAAGEALFKTGKSGVPACQYCHGAQGQGLAPVFARLAGQHASYIVESIQPYRKVDDFKNPYAFVMKAVVQNLTDAEIEAVARYLEALK